MAAIDEASQPQGRPLHFLSRRARGPLAQFRACVWKFNAVMWRSPEYNSVRCPAPAFPGYNSCTLAPVSAAVSPLDLQYATCLSGCSHARPAACEKSKQFQETKASWRHLVSAFDVLTGYCARWGWPLPLAAHSLAPATTMIPGR